MTDKLFTLIPTNKSIIDETGDNAGYNYYKIKLNKNLKMLLKKISIQVENKAKVKKYDFLAIPNFNSSQEYFIRPIKISNNLELIDEMHVLKNYATNNERINRYYFYDDESEKDIDTILASLGYQYYKNKLALGVFASESGVAYFKPLVKKKLIIPSRFKPFLEEIELNSWRINILLKLSDSFKNEYGANYKGSLGIRSFLFNRFVERLIDLHLLYKKEGWVYDVYRLFNFDDDRNRYFIYETMKLPEINNDTLKPILEKVKIDLQIRREEFERLYSDLLDHYISNRYEEFIKNEESLKPILLKFLGLDYK